MGRSTFISAALHTAIFIWALVAFPAAKMEAVPLIAIPVDLASPSEVPKIKAGMADAKDEGVLAAKPKAPKPQAVKEKQAKPPEETAAVPAPKDKEPPKPELKKEQPKKEEPKKAAEKPAPKQEDAKPKPPVKQAEKHKPTPKPQPKPAAEAKKRDFNTDKIAALLNKIPDATNEPKPQEFAEETRPVRGQSDGTELAMSVNEIDALRARIAQCWNPPPGGLGADEIVVKLRLKLNEDGTLVGYPAVANRGSSPFFQAAADSAVRAVYQCQPYELPRAKYGLWRDMILNFDPSDMYGAG